MRESANAAGMLTAMVIATTKSDTSAELRKKPTYALDADLERPGGEDMRLVDRAAGGEDAHDVEVGEGDDEREQHRDGDDVAHHRQRDVPELLPPVGAVDRGRLVELLGNRLERGEVHDHEERRTEPDVHQDHREARPVRVTEPAHRQEADVLEDQLKALYCGSNSHNQ